MSGTLRYVLRNLARRRVRTVAGVLGIFLTTGLLTAIQIGLDSVSNSYVDLAAISAGKADLVIIPEGGHLFRPEPFDPAPLIARVEPLPHVRGLSPRLIGFGQIPHDGKAHFVYVLGIDAARERELAIMGFTPDPQLGDGLCAVSESVAKRLKLKIGDPVSLVASDIGGLKVGSIIERQLSFPQQLRDYLVLDLKTARSVLGEETDVHMLAGSFDDPRAFYDARDLHASVRRLRKVGENVAATLGPDYTVLLPKAIAMTIFQNLSAPVRAAFGVFALLALSVTGLLIYSLVSVGVEERIREFAILRTLGARGRYVVGLVLLEAIVLCLGGVLPGTFCGLGVAKGLLWLVEKSMGSGGEPVHLSLSMSTLWLCMGAGGVLAVASSLAPAMAAVRRRIVDALDPLRRGQMPAEAAPEGSAHRPMLFTGLALSSISVVVFFVLPNAFLSGDASLIGVVVLGLLMSILLGFTLMGMGILPWVERVVLATIGWSLGPVAEMARRNLSRHRRRHATTALMFTLSVAFVLFIASLVALFNRTSAAMLEDMTGADVRVQSGDGPAGGDEAQETLAKVSGVRALSRAATLRHRTQRGVAYDVVVSDLVSLHSLWVTAVGADAALGDAMYARLVGYAEGDRTAFAALAADTGGTMEHPPVILCQSAARALDVHAGDLVNVSFRLGSHRTDARFRVAAVCSSIPGFDNFTARIAAAQGSGVMMSLPRLDAMTRAAKLPDAERRQAFHVIYLISAGDAQEEVARRIREEYGVKYQFGVESVREQARQAEVLYWATQVLFGLLLVVAVLIAVFSLIASMATTVSERRWEIGVLKALGLRRGQLFRLFLGEATVLTLSAGAAGAGIGYGLAYLFVLQAATLGEMPVVFTLPYLTVAATFGVSVVSAAVASYLPARRLLRHTAAEIFRIVD